MCRNIVCLLLVAPLALAPSFVRAETVSFEQAELGILPAEFETGLAGNGEPGRWEVVRDETAAGGRALAQLTTNPDDYRFLVAIYKPVAAADVEVTARFKPVAGKTDQAGGVAVRIVDANNYYLARANALEDNVRFYRVARGKRRQLATADAKVTAGQWHALTLRAQGDRFTVSFDGKPMHTTTDTTGFPRPGSGRVGVWTKADSVTHFDRIDIRVLP
jgi:hypothetical protein